MPVRAFAVVWVADGLPDADVAGRTDGHRLRRSRPTEALQMRATGWTALRLEGSGEEERHLRQTHLRALRDIGWAG